MADTHTTKDVIDLLMDMKTTQAADGARQEAQMGVVHKDVKGINRRLDKQNDRILSLEKKWWVMWGGIAVGVGVAKLWAV